MIMPVKGPITAPFNEMRPLSADADKRTHIHGAIDIAAPVSTPIYAPEEGKLFAFAAFRPDNSRSWTDGDIDAAYVLPKEFCNYFYDTYGTCLMLFAKSGRLHVFCHSYLNQIFNRGTLAGWRYAEERKQARWPVNIWHTFNKACLVREGTQIRLVGNAGYSTGPHVHWEIHPTRTYAPHEKRIDPVSLTGGPL